MINGGVLAKGDVGQRGVAEVVIHPTTTHSQIASKSDIGQRRIADHPVGHPTAKLVGGIAAECDICQPGTTEVVLHPTAVTS